MNNLPSTAEHRLHRLVLVLFGLFTSCDALVTIDEAAEASGSILTPERSAQAATLPRPAPGGEADTDDLRKNGVTGLASGLDKDRRRHMTLVDKPRCRPFEAMGASTRSEVPHSEEIYWLTSPRAQRTLCNIFSRPGTLTHSVLAWTCITYMYTWKDPPAGLFFKKMSKSQNRPFPPRKRVLNLSHLIYFLRSFFRLRAATPPYIELGPRRQPRRAKILAIAV